MSVDTPIVQENTFTRWQRGFAVQRRILVGLIIRQLMVKYGRHNIGFLWIVLEPMILCSGVLVVRSLIQGHEENGLPLISLLVTGYMPLTLWRHLTGQGCFILRRASSLLYHRDITLFDCCISAVLNEVAGCTLAAVVVYWTLYTLNLVGPVYDLGIVICGWLMMACLSIGVMMIFAVLTEYYEASERFIQPFQYLILPICGFFYMVTWLPTYAQKLAWFVPTVHCYEMIRAGVFGPTVLTYYTPWYPGLWCLGFLAYALPMVDKAREKIHFG